MSCNYIISLIALLLFVGGKLCIEKVVASQRYHLLQILICDHRCDPQFLVIDPCSTPIHSALIFGLHKDPG